MTKIQLDYAWGNRELKSTLTQALLNIFNLVQNCIHKCHVDVSTAKWFVAIKRTGTLSFFLKILFFIEWGSCSLNLQYGFVHGTFPTRALMYFSFDPQPIMTDTRCFPFFIFLK